MYKVKEHEVNPKNYLVMEGEDFNSFIKFYMLPIFDDDGMLFTYYNNLQIVKKFEEKISNDYKYKSGFVKV